MWRRFAVARLPRSGIAPELVRARIIEVASSASEAAPAEARAGPEAAGGAGDNRLASGSTRVTALTSTMAWAGAMASASMPSSATTSAAMPRWRRPVACDGRPEVWLMVVVLDQLVQRAAEHVR